MCPGCSQQARFEIWKRSHLSDPPLLMLVVRGLLLSGVGFEEISGNGGQALTQSSSSPARLFCRVKHVLPLVWALTRQVLSSLANEVRQFLALCPGLTLG